MADLDGSCWCWCQHGWVQWCAGGKPRPRPAEQARSQPVVTFQGCVTGGLHPCPKAAARMSESCLLNAAPFTGSVSNCSRKAPAPSIVWEETSYAIPKPGQMGAVFNRAQLLLIRSVARLMGGAGDHYVPSELAQSMVEASKLVEGIKEWLPAPYHDLVRKIGTSAKGTKTCHNLPRVEQKRLQSAEITVCWLSCSWVMIVWGMEGTGN
eukprot:scaffold23170_cov20-Tisochrysis_lutea.AAC.1